MIVGKYSDEPNKPRPIAFQHPTTPIYGCALSFAIKDLEYAVAKLCSVASVAACGVFHLIASERLFLFDIVRWHFKSVGKSLFYLNIPRWILQYFYRVSYSKHNTTKYNVGGYI